MPPIHIYMPALPSPPSWFPGHMRKFTRILPALLKRTDIVLEIRDSRLPLTSINKQLEGMSVNFSRRNFQSASLRDFELCMIESLSFCACSEFAPGALRQWRLERGWDANNPGRRVMNNSACDHIVVLNKRDLVSEWGMEVSFEATEWPTCPFLSGFILSTGR